MSIFGKTLWAAAIGFLMSASCNASCGYAGAEMSASAGMADESAPAPMAPESRTGAFMQLQIGRMSGTFTALESKFEPLTFSSPLEYTLDNGVVLTSDGDVEDSAKQRGIILGTQFGYNWDLGSQVFAGVGMGVHYMGASGNMICPVNLENPGDAEVMDIPAGESIDDSQICRIHSRGHASAFVQGGFHLGAFKPYVQVGWTCMMSRFSSSKDVTFMEMPKSRRYFHGVLVGGGFSYRFPSSSASGSSLGVTFQHHRYNARWCPLMESVDDNGDANGSLMASLRPRNNVFMVYYEFEMPENKGFTNY